MTACFHLPSVTCENCERVVTFVVTKNRVSMRGLRPKSDSAPTGYNPPLAADDAVLYTRQQVEAMLRTALTDRRDEWTIKTVDERVEALLGMFTLTTRTP